MEWVSRGRAKEQCLGEVLHVVSENWRIRDIAAVVVEHVNNAVPIVHIAKEVPFQLLPDVVQAHPRHGVQFPVDDAGGLISSGANAEGYTMSIIILNKGSAQVGYVIDILLESGRSDFHTVDTLKGVEEEALFYAQRGQSPKVAVCASSPAIKQDLVNEVLYLGCKTPALIHPRANLSRSCEVGISTIINAGVTVEHGAKIGAGVVLHAGAVVDHDCHIRWYANLAPGVLLAGGVTVGDRSILYTGVKVAPNVTIGEDCIIGAGAVVLEDIPPGRKAWGVPCKPKGPARND